MNIIKYKITLRKIVKELQSEGKSVAFTTGCFDILHVGHLDLFEAAKSVSDILIVAVATDEIVKISKGNSRPINKFEDRAKIIASLKQVDYVYKNNTFKTAQLISNIPINIFIKAKENNSKELEYIKKKGIKVLEIKKKIDLSSTFLLKTMNYTRLTDR